MTYSVFHNGDPVAICWSSHSAEAERDVVLLLRGGGRAWIEAWPREYDYELQFAPRSELRDFVTEKARRKGKSQR